MGQRPTTTTAKLKISTGRSHFLTHIISFKLKTSMYLFVYKVLSSEIMNHHDDGVAARIQKIEEIVSADLGGRGISSLIVPGDLYIAAQLLASLQGSKSATYLATVLILSGFPCCVNEQPPTETDGPSGSLAIARAAIAFNFRAVIVTDECNRDVFLAASCGTPLVEIDSFPPVLSSADEERFQQLAKDCDLLISCERPGPSQDGNCYTMRGINMNELGLIAPLRRFVELRRNVPFIAIGDGGNELGMGKVYDKIITNPLIRYGEKIGCVIAADRLVTSGVSNWGGYALAAAAVLLYAHNVSCIGHAADREALIQFYLSQCLPSDQEEIELMDRCIAAGCRDGVTGLLEATVDGMPLEISLQCLRDIRSAALGQFQGGY
jgi:D-glutamate cyclase